MTSDDDLRENVERNRTSDEAVSIAAKARQRVALSQAAFAELMGVSLRTLQDWEQGRREPSGAASVLLSVASMRPDAVSQTLAAESNNIQSEAKNPMKLDEQKQAAIAGLITAVSSEVVGHDSTAFVLDVHAEVSMARRALEAHDMAEIDRLGPVLRDRLESLREEKAA